MIKLTSQRMVEESEKFAESDKARRQVIEESNRAESFVTETSKSMEEFEAQLDAAEKEKVKTLLDELREIAAKGAAGDASVKAEDIKAAMDAAQTGSLGLFAKVYEKRNADSKASEQPTEEKDSSEEKKN
jgi:molecular chaperone DnaK